MNVKDLNILVQYENNLELYFESNDFDKVKTFKILDEIESINERIEKIKNHNLFYSESNYIVGSLINKRKIKKDGKITKT